MTVLFVSFLAVIAVGFTLVGLHDALWGRDA